jgi:O-antigen/teichoic acid export membrane protein
MDKKSDKSRILINSVFISGSTVFNNLIFLIINIIIARYLSVEHFGEYTTALAFATFFSTLVNIGINQTLIRAINLESTLEREHFGNALIIKTSLAIIVYSAMALSLYFTNYNRNTIYLAFIFGLVRIGNEYLSVFYAVYEAKEKFILRSIFLVFFSLSFLLGTVIVVLHKGNYFHFAYIRLFIVILFIVILILVTMRHFSIRFDITTIRKFTRSAIPFSLATIYTNIRQRISLIILSLMEGTRETGIFNNGAIFFSTLEIIRNNVVLPISFLFSLFRYSYNSHLRRKI